MNREIVVPRPDWKAKLEKLGIGYHTVGGVPYWNEGVAYRFSLDEINRIEAATNTLHELAIAAVEDIIAKDRFEEMGIGARARKLITDSWNNPTFGELSVFGRFDLAYDGRELKMLEYNADTPTSLPEAAVAQWDWLEETHKGCDQFNSIHEKLIERWKRMGINRRLYMSCMQESEEDFGNVGYMADVATQAGINTAFIFVEDIGWDERTKRFVETTGAPIAQLFKLYPWEWLIADEFGDRIEAVRVIEPAWKMLLSNKGILAIMWSIAPNHSNLLEASFDDKVEGVSIKKPTLSREGSNISVVRGKDELAATDGPYGGGKFVYQRLASIPNMDGHYPVLGSWIIGEEAAGLGIRESDTPITGNLSQFVPHYIE